MPRKERNFDHKEDSCVRFYMYEKKGSTIGRSSGWSRWYGVARGDDCLVINPWQPSPSPRRGG